VGRLWPAWTPEGGSPAVPEEEASVGTPAYSLGTREGVAGTGTPGTS